MTGGTGALNLLVEPLGCAGAADGHVAGGVSGGVNCTDFQLVLLPRFMWFRPGQSTIGPDGSVEFAPLGFAPSWIQPTASPATPTPAPGTSGGGH